MDLILHLCDEYFLDRVWAKALPATVLPSAALHTTAQIANDSLLHTTKLGQENWWSLAAEVPVSAWPRDYIPRQLISITTLTLIGIALLYFIFAGLSYQFIFNHEMMKHPRFLKNQVKLEIQTSLQSFPGMTALTLPWFQAEIMGYSKLYDSVDEYGWGYFIFSIFFFLIFTDYCIYWIHRWLHLPLIYKHIHKPHHKWIIPTPFASHAFHPVDGYAQSVPYHLFIFLFPMHRKLYLGMFTFVNFWAIFIHDSDMITGHPLEKIINGPAHHTLHHIYFTVNYGQYFTWADRFGDSYRHPESELDPLHQVRALEKEQLTKDL